MYIAYSNTNSFRTSSSLHTSTDSERSADRPVKKIVRFVAIVLMLFLVFSFGAMVQAYAGSEASLSKINLPSQDNALTKVVVEKGDTLWEIASRYSVQDGNIRSYINRIKELNHLSSSSLREGQILLIP